jgi:two-component system, chemotaxis family, chemotaxis protein CheY
MPYNILIVDDSDTVRAVITKTLGLTGVDLNEVYQASNGQEGLDLLRGGHWVDLVFTDINMPVMNGVEMFRAMQQDERLKDIPVVVVSTEGSKTRIDALTLEGIRAYIRKPFTPENLRDVLQKILGE